MKLTILTRVIFIFTFFGNLLVFAGGDSVNNGGGLSEQAIIYASLNYSKFSDSCLKFPSCAAVGPLNSKLTALKTTCEFPTSAKIKFSKTLSAELVYTLNENKDLIINRQKLYSQKVLTVPEAFGFLTRIYFELCDQVRFSESETLTAPIVNHASQQSEQVTVGKDTISLPAAQWVRVRSMYSDLLVEAPSMLVRLSCGEEKLSSCVLSEVADSRANTKFRYLTLRSEKIVDGEINFEVEGYFLTLQGKEKFVVQVVISNNLLTKFTLQGVDLKIP